MSGSIAPPRLLRARSLALLLALSLLAGLTLHPTPAVAAAVGLTVDQWAADADTGRVSYSLAATGTTSGLCDTQWCYWRVEAAYLDGSTTQVKHTLGSGSLPPGTGSFSRAVTGSNAILEEVTHVRARLYPSGGSPEESTGWVPMHAPYPDASITLQPTVWDVDTATGRVSYDLQVDGRGLGGNGEPCDTSYCYLRVEAAYLDGTSTQVRHTLDGPSFAPNTWAVSRHLTADATLLEEVTHLRARIYKSGGAPQVDSGWIEVHAPYPDSEMTIGVNHWSVDTATGKVTYDLQVDGRGLGGEGQPCDTSYCYLRVEAAYLDGSSTQVEHTLDGPSFAPNTWAVSRHLTADATLLEEVTHLRARIYQSGGALEVSTGWISVHGAYPAAKLLTSVNSWSVTPATTDPDTGQVTSWTIAYDVEVDGYGLGGHGEPCDTTYCYLRVEAMNGETAVATLSSPSYSANTWRVSHHTTGTATTNVAPTGVRARIYQSGGAPQVTSRTSAVANGGVVSDIILTGYVSRLASVPFSSLCTELALIPGLPNTDADSPNDAWKTCEASVAAGKTRDAVIRDVVKHLVAAGLVATVATYVTDRWIEKTVPDPPPPAPKPDDPNGDPPKVPYIPQPNIDATIADSLRARAHEASSLATADDATLQQIAATCRRLAARAGLGDNGTLTDFRAHPCETENIYIPGSDVPQAAAHRVKAIWQHPAWFRLNYMSNAEKLLTGLPRGWYSTEDVCVSKPSGTSCDEYPNYSSRQSGPGASLEAIDSTDNSLEGTRYGTFVQACSLTSAVAVGAEAVGGEAFLVVPMPVGPPSTHICQLGG